MATTKTNENKMTEKKMVSIKLPRLPKEKDTGPVPVSVNGEKYWVPRGVKCSVPDYIAEVLEHAEIEADRADEFIRTNSTD